MLLTFVQRVFQHAVVTCPHLRSGWATPVPPLPGGAIALIPYFFIPTAHIALKYSCTFTDIVPLVSSAVNVRITNAASKRVDGYVWGAVSKLVVGGAAAAAAYGIVALMEVKE